MNEVMGSPEAESEHIPNLAEVHAIFRELIRGQYIIKRQSEDANGLTLLEVTVDGERGREEIGYEYMRAGRHAGDEASATAIHKVYYKYGEAVGGDLIASYVAGEWKIIK